MIKLCFKFFYLIKRMKLKFIFLIEILKPRFILKSSYKNKLDLNNIVAYDTVSVYRKETKIKQEYINKEPKIDLSIIIPIYNSEKYIKKCLDSIIYQNNSYQIEIICINDGSTDRSLEILSSYNDDRIKIVNQSNQGAARARNIGINMAIGKYIMFIDSDDFLMPNSIDNLLQNAYQKNADIVTGNINKYISKYDKIISTRRHKYFITDNLLKMCNMSDGAPWGKIYKKSLWNNVRFHEGQAFEDCVVFLNVYPKAKIFIYIDFPIYCFRSSTTSLYKRSINNYVSLDSFWGVLNSYNMIDNKENISVEQIQLFMWHLTAIMYRRIQKIEINNVKIAIIILSKKLIFEMIEKSEEKISNFYGSNARFYLKILRTLKDGTLEEWEHICKIIWSSGKI